ncbi:MAG: TonB-dependent receptor [Methylococcales bacterium]|jgi:iron complex outermembrane recepter protein
MNNNALFTLGLLTLTVCQVAYAKDDIKKSVANETPLVLEDITIIGEQSAPDYSFKNEITAEEVYGKQAQVSDTAKLLEDTAGVSLQTGGGVSSLPIIHGLNDDRVKIEVNGMSTPSSCPNHMNPALSYIDRTNIGTITILQGVTPVSMGGDSIGGTISLQSSAPVFAEPGNNLLITGKASSFYRSNGNAFGGSIAAGIANEHARLEYTGSDTQSGNYSDGNGAMIKSSGYETQNHAAALSFKFDNHLLEIRGGQQHMPYQGFPTARMDLTDNDSINGNVHYKGVFGWGSLDSKLYLENSSHTMNYGSDRNAIEPMPMTTSGINYGYKIQAEIPFNEQNTFRFGNELISSLINDYWSPTSSMPSMMGPNTFLNLNNANRDRIGTFAEWELYWSKEWKSMLGIRHDHVMSNTGNAQAYNNITSDYYQALAFNSLSHQRNFDLFDMTALMQFTPNLWSQYDFGYARKNRAPSLHELYVWDKNPMPMTMNGWFGDGNGYLGNMNLKVETAHNVTFTATFNDPKATQSWSIKATPYVSYVENFIDADRCKTCNQPTNNFSYLQFANHDAFLWGTDVTASADLFTHKTFGHFATHSTMSYVRGQRTDGANLYHMMPFNLKLSLDHKLEGWKNAFEMQFVDSKNDIQSIRNELQTPSYILLNAKTGYQWKNVGLDVGLDNLLNKEYFYPLAGAYIGNQYAMTLNQSKPNNLNLPGLGRSVYVGMTITY